MDASWTRSAHLDRLRENVFDVLVVGGGVIGSGSALDLAGRGLSVALVERTDFAQGTSSRSTKLFHGGIRYLPHLEFGLVSEGLREQKVLARIADFLFHPLEFVIPLYRQYGLADAPTWAARGRRAPWALGAGLSLYDLLGGVGRPGRRHRHVSAAELAAEMPTLRPDGLEAGFVYSDAQTDDARLVITLAKTAVRRHGLVAAGRVMVERLEPTADGYLAHVRDTLERRDSFTVRARSVLAATGAFPPPGVDAVHPLELVHSKGTHLVVDGADLDLGDRALVLPETDDGRVLFVVPWFGHWMIGTTDTLYRGDPAHPRPDPEDVEYLLRHVHRFLDVPDFEPISGFAGLRALRADRAGSTASASREHVIEEPLAGFVRVAGGKLTTYRRIAAEASDRVAAHLGASRRSETARIPLVGAGAAGEVLASAVVAAGVPSEVARSLVGRYGLEATVIAAMVEDHPSLAARFGDGRTIAAEVVYAARHEAAAKVSDFTLRRTRLAWFTRDHARADAPRVAELLGGVLGWSTERTRRELEDHETELVSEGL